MGDIPAPLPVNCTGDHPHWPRYTNEHGSNICNRGPCRLLVNPCANGHSDARYYDPVSGRWYCGGCWVVMVSEREWGLAPRAA